jgi:hypothetical protein
MRLIEKNIFCVLFIFVLLISTGICIAAEPVYERPIYKEGDFWVFVNRNQFKERTHKFLREEKDKYVFGLDESDRTKQIYFTSDIGIGIGYPGPVIDFPLTVGKKWDCKFQKKRTTGITERDLKIARFKVESYESVTVPAGTFQAFKITVIIERIKGGKIKESASYWYAPKVKQLIKRIRKGNTWELKEFKIK